MGILFVASSVFGVGDLGYQASSEPTHKMVGHLGLSVFSGRLPARMECIQTLGSLNIFIFFVGWTCQEHFLSTHTTPGDLNADASLSTRLKRLSHKSSISSRDVRWRDKETPQLLPSQEQKKDGPTLAFHVTWQMPSRHFQRCSSTLKQGYWSRTQLQVWDHGSCSRSPPTSQEWTWTNLLFWCFFYSPTRNAAWGLQPQSLRTANRFPQRFLRQGSNLRWGW